MGTQSLLPLASMCAPPHVSCNQSHKYHRLAAISARQSILMIAQQNSFDFICLLQPVRQMLLLGSQYSIDIVAALALVAHQCLQGGKDDGEVGVVEADHLVTK